MKIFNAVNVYIFNFICIIVFTPIAKFVVSSLIYDKIPHVDVTNPTGFVIFDILRETDDFYPLGLIANPSADAREFFVDDLVTFGKDVKIVFGTKYVSLTPFARNIKLTAKTVNFRVHIYIDYDLHGTKIYKKYHETGITAPGQPKSFKFVQVESGLELEELSGEEYSSEGSELEEPKKREKKLFFTPHGTVIEYSDYGEEDQADTSLRGKEPEPTAPPPTPTPAPAPEAQPAVIAPTAGVTPEQPAEHFTVLDSQATVETQDTFQEVAITPSAAAPPALVSPAPIPSITPSVTPGDEINVLEEDLSGKTGFQSAEIVKGQHNDFRCVWFKNESSSDLHKKLKLKDFFIPLSKDADAFEVCYDEYDVGKHNFMTSTQFSSIVVEQIYKWSGSIEPLLTFDPFAGLKSYSERRMGGDTKTIPAPFELDVDNFNPDSNSPYDKIEAGKCKVYRYKDGLEDDSRLGGVTSLKFGSNKYDIPTGKKFVMVSICKPFLSTNYVVIMLKEFFQYESLVFYSENGTIYREKKGLDDDERLQLINMTSKVWHKRQSSGSMGNFDEAMDDEVEVLCLNQFTKKSENTPNHCKTVDKLSNFKVLYDGDDFTNLVFIKRSPKSSMVIGNAILDLTVDNQNDKYIYLSHPPKEPITLVVLNGEHESYSLTEKSFGSNVFLPVTNSFYTLRHKANKKDLNFGLYRGTVYGITWDFNDYLKKHYLFASKFPEYCLGDLMFRNMKITCNREEGYKQVTSDRLDKFENVTVTVLLPEGKIVLAVTVDSKKYTSVELKSKPTGTQRHDEL